MKNIKFLFIVLSFFFFNCSNDDSPLQKSDDQNLSKMYTEIIAASMVNSYICTNPVEWSFVTIGSKACGGSLGFIVYSLKMDILEFLKKYKTIPKHKKHRIKNGAFSQLVT